MKQRIFIAAHYLEIGGAEISLIGLLQTIDYSRYDVDLFLYRHVGELIPLIPKEVNLLPEIPIYAQFETPLKHTLFSRFWRIGLARLKTKWQYHQFAKTHECLEGNAYFQFLAENVTPLLPSLYNLGEYDLAINFIGLMNIIRDKVKAKKKVAWIHTDYSNVSVFPEMELPVWDSFDYVTSISPDVTKTFLQVFPSLAPKIIEIENILSSTFVRYRADEIGSTDNRQQTTDLEQRSAISGQQSVINLLSIGRFTNQKNFDNLPDICKKTLELLKEKNIDVRWYIIGFGADENLIRQKIAETGMQEHVIILGKKANPYPYIKACDIYVQPSRYEGKSVTVREAQMLCKPVVVTNYPTASSQIKNGDDGVIVPLDNEGCAKGLAEFILDTEKQEHIIEHLKAHDYGNVEEVEKIYKLIN